MRVAQESPPTKKRLLDAAERLMLTRGYAATTVDEICEAAHLTKGSFFHYFDSKGQLGREVLERFCAVGRKMHQACCGSESDPLKRVYTYLNKMIRMSKDPAMSKGCLLGLFSQELCDTNPQIRAACKKGFDDWARTFGEEVAKAKAAYAPRASFHPEELAEHLIAIMEGSMIMGKARRDMSIVGQNLAHFKAYIKSLFGNS